MFLNQIHFMRRSIGTHEIILFFALNSILFQTYSQSVADFDTLTLAPDSYWNGADLSGGFSCGEAFFPNIFVDWGGGVTSWGIFAYSNKTDTVTLGYSNQYSAYAGAGYAHTPNFAVAYFDGMNDIYLKMRNNAMGDTIAGFYITNNSYSALSMKYGDAYSKKFTSADHDWFRLVINGYRYGIKKTDSVVFYLADFRYADSSLNYIVKDWRWVDLNVLGSVDSIGFRFSSSDNGMYGMNTPAYFCMDNLTIKHIDTPLLFPPSAGQPGSTAIHKDSSCFVAWANSCTIHRGFLNISDTASGYATTGDSSMATGSAGQNGVVSLGDGGSAILTFERPLYNGLGYDFAVFENAFSDYFLELAFVDVSSDGIHYFRFPAVSLTDTSSQITAYDSLDTRKINNLAGKYRAPYGTPFDLEELKNEPGLDVNQITHVRITDVVGSINNQYARRDSRGNKINDPWPTQFPSSGFDLDAVGVIHQLPADIEDKQEVRWELYPNPVKDFLYLRNLNGSSRNVSYKLFNINGLVLFSSALNDTPENQANHIIDLSEFNPGTYILMLSDKNHTWVSKVVIIK